MGDLYFEALTPLGVRVRTTSAYWARIVTFKHPVMRGREAQVQRTLREPTQVRRSTRDPSVQLYYAPDSPYNICVVVKCLNGEGFIVTAYRTDAIKEGELLWPR